MPEIANNDELLNQEFEPVLMRALQRFRELLPAEVAVVHYLAIDGPRVRLRAQLIEDLVFSACMVAWQSMTGQARQIVIEASEVVLDNIELDSDAEVLKGGLPPRAYVRLLISNDRREEAGPLHVAMTVPELANLHPGATRRLKVPQMQKVVQQHKGTFSVMVDRELGSAFDVYLPLSSALEGPAINTSGGGIQHIVYVDDYRAMRELAEEFLSDAGFRVSCFENARDALASLQDGTTPCDAVVTDYKLPDLSGIELLRQLKQLNPQLPVVIISGYMDEVLIARAKAEGAALVLSKSDDLGALSEALHALLALDPNTNAGSFTDWANL